jgi:hypothetical protein
VPAHVALSEVEVDAGFQGPGVRLLEHRGRRVDSDHRSAGRLGERNRDPAVPDGKLDERPVGLARKLGIERDVLRHLHRPVVVTSSEGFVPAHRPMLRALIDRDHAAYWVRGK